MKKKFKKPSLFWRLYSWFINSTRLGGWVENQLARRCDDCPMVETDYADYNETGYTEAVCGLGKKDMLCAFPLFYRRRKRAELDAIEAARDEADYKMWQEEEQARREAEAEARLLQIDRFGIVDRYGGWEGKQELVGVIHTKGGDRYAYIYPYDETVFHNPGAFLSGMITAYYSCVVGIEHNLFVLWDKTCGQCEYHDFPQKAQSGRCDHPEGPDAPFLAAFAPACPCFQYNDVLVSLEEWKHGITYYIPCEERIHKIAFTD